MSSNEMKQTCRLSVDCKQAGIMVTHTENTTGSFDFKYDRNLAKTTSISQKTDLFLNQTLSFTFLLSFLHLKRKK